MKGRLGLVGLSLMMGWMGCSDRGRALLSGGELSVEPAELNFERVAIYDGRNLELTMTNLSRAQVRVLSMTLEGDYRATLLGLQEPHELGSGQHVPIRVRFAPQGAGEQKTTLVVETDVPNGTFRIPLNGEGVDARAEVPERTLHYGRIEAESEKSLPLRMRNGSTLPVEVRTQFIGADRDEFEAPTQVLAPGEQRWIDITFKPTRVGRKRAVLAVSPCRGCADQILPIVAEAIDRAVVAEPPIIDFGQMPVDRGAAAKTKFHNISTEPMEITGFGLSEGSDLSFSAEGFPGTFQLGPDETREFEVRYNPTHLGQARGTAALGVRSKRNPETPVALNGFGGSAELCVSPPSYDFGIKPVGAKVAMTLYLKNCGSANGAPLEIQSMSFGTSLPGEDQFHMVPQQLPRQLPAGQSLAVKIFFEPTREGAAEGLLTVRTSATLAAEVTLPFRGRGQQHAPCNVSVTPSRLDFGNVSPGRGAVLAVKVSNRGSDLCAVKNIRLTDDAGGAFRMPGGTVDGMVLAQGEYFAFQVALVTPNAATGPLSGNLGIQVANPGMPQVDVPLSAGTENACLVAIPAYMDFGVTSPVCPPKPRVAELLNRCSSPIDLNALWIGSGTTDGEFVIAQAPTPLPRTLAPGTATSVEVHYLSQWVGMNASPLFAEVTGTSRPVLIPLVAESSSQSERVDRFIQQDGSKVDVLFVIDNTASMVEEAPKLLAALPTFASTARTQGVDLHVAVTTTGIEPVSAACPGGALGGEAGRLFPVDGSRERILTHLTADLESRLQQNASVGLCGNFEQGFEAMRRALVPPLVDELDDPTTPEPNDGNAGFLRLEAGLAVVFVGDEDDHSPESVDAYVKFLLTAKGQNQEQRAAIYAIAPTGALCPTAGGEGTRYAEAALRTGGEVLSICAPDFAPLLQSVAQRAFGPQARFPLTAAADAGNIRVTIDGTPTVSGWTFEPTSNSVVFQPPPAPGARISIAYRKACRN